MKIFKNQNLSTYTTFKVGGIAENLYIPESVEELTGLLKTLNDIKFIGGGSNLLINDTKIYKSVICFREFDKSITNLGKGCFKAGASVRLQEFIITMNKLGYGGLEYLISVPGLLGGAIFMNAGRGKDYNMSISDCITNVTIFHNGRIETLNKESCKFSYRSSIFKETLQGSYIILSAELRLLAMDTTECDRKRKERIEFCSKHQDNTAPNFGTVFCNANQKIMSLFCKFPFGKADGICFSKKTVNWMLNYNNGRYQDAVGLIKRVKLLHRLLGMDCRTEIIIWD